MTAARKPLDMLEKFLTTHNCWEALSVLQKNLAALESRLTAKSVKAFMKDPQQAVLDQQESNIPNRKPSPRSRR